MLTTSISCLLDPALCSAPLVVFACSSSLRSLWLANSAPPSVLACLLSCALSPPSRWAPPGVLFHVYGARLSRWAPPGVLLNVCGARFRAGHRVCFSHVCGARLSRLVPFLLFFLIGDCCAWPPPGASAVTFVEPAFVLGIAGCVGFSVWLYSLHSSAL